MATESVPRNVEFDEDGFLVDPQAWDRALAESLARDGGLGDLTDVHWAVLQSLRKFYFRYGAPPWVGHACHENHLDEHCLSTLFGGHPIAAWRIAGLPNPGEEAKAYL